MVKCVHMQARGRQLALLACRRSSRHKLGTKQRSLQASFFQDLFNEKRNPILVPIFFAMWFSILGGNIAVHPRSNEGLKRAELCR